MRFRRELGSHRVASDSVSRLAYARDSSSLALRAVPKGTSTWHPDVIVWPETTPEVARLTELVRDARLPLIPYGAGSGVVGGALSPYGGVLLDLKRMNRVLNVDPVSMTVTVQAGILGQHLEEYLNTFGYTCGHYPQSLHCSTVGGWIAHRGVGTFSNRFGKIDDLVVALEVVLPNGKILRTRNVPTSAAGPDLNRLFLGSEGGFGTITEATLKVFYLPESRSLGSFAFDGFGAALECIRQAIQAHLPLAAVRVYDPLDARANFPDVALTVGQGLVLVAVEGNPEQVQLTTRQFTSLATRLGGQDKGTEPAELWLDRRFSTAALCRTLASPNGIADTLEVANSWARIAETYERMRAGMLSVIGEGTVYGHASHFYHTGANLYMVFHAFSHGSVSIEETYYAVLEAALSACLAQGGTLTHHHGVGLVKGRWMSTELGDSGMELLAAIKAGLDPLGFMNPGKLGLPYSPPK